MLFILYPCVLLCASLCPCCVLCNNWNYNQSDFSNLDKLTDSWLILFEACRLCRGPFYALANPSKLLCIFLFSFDLLNPALNGSSNEYSFVLMGSTTLTDSFLSFFEFSAIERLSEWSSSGIDRHEKRIASLPCFLCFSDLFTTTWWYCYTQL